MKEERKNFINVDEVPQDKFDNTEGGVSNGHGSANESDVSINWWYVASIALALAAAVIIALIV